MKLLSRLVGQLLRQKPQLRLIHLRVGPQLIISQLPSTSCQCPPCPSVLLKSTSRYAQVVLLRRQFHVDVKEKQSSMPMKEAQDELDDFDAFSEEEKQKRQARMKKSLRMSSMFITIWALGAITFVLLIYGPEKVDETTGLSITDVFSERPTPIAYIMRCYYELFSFYQSVVEPSREKLLPEPLPEPYIQPKYTLVIEHNGVLVHPDWTYETGWRFKIRPAVEHFLRLVGYPNFEVVVYTADGGMSAMEIIDGLDPENKYIMYRLFKDATKYTNGHHVKDLCRLNRDLSRVILLDWDPASFQLNPENALCVPRWQGDDADTALVDLAELLKTILTSNVDDVRPVLQHYSQFDDPAKQFREQSEKLAQTELSSKTVPTKGLAKNYTGFFGYRRHT